MLLYAVTDSTWLNGRKLVDDVEDVLKAGATFIQLRDNVEAAKEVDADGVHIGQSDTEAKRARDILGKNKIIGVSAGNLKEAVEAEKNGADYIGIGAMFDTSTKKDHTDMTFEEAKKITDTVKIPVVAIGGINKNNIMKLKGTGVDGVAVISAIFAQPDRYSAAKELLELSKEIVR